MVAGLSGRVYALANPKKNNAYTIHRWADTKWVKVPGKTASEIAVGFDGKLYIIDIHNRIFVAHPFTREVETVISDCRSKKISEERTRIQLLQLVKADELIAECDENEICVKRAR